MKTKIFELLKKVYNYYYSKQKIALKFVAPIATLISSKIGFNITPNYILHALAGILISATLILLIDKAIIGSIIAVTVTTLIAYWKQKIDGRTKLGSKNWTTFYITSIASLIPAIVIVVLSLI